MKIPYKLNPFGLSTQKKVSGPLTLTAEMAGSTVTLVKNGTFSLTGIQYRRNSSSNWYNYTLGTTLSLNNIGDYVQFQNTENTLSTSSSNYVQFSMTGLIKASGNIMSMLNYRSDVPYRGFSYLFASCSSLTQAPDLPATTLAGHCYNSMFNSCSSLTTAPDLPATTLDQYCYSNMFQNCTSLTKAPELPATRLTQHCYESMFRNCYSLSQAPELPATGLASYCYYLMFYNCTSLTTAPDLPATTLADYCYYMMFYGCSALTSMRVYFTSFGGSSATYTQNWLQNANSSGTFYKLSSLSISSRNDSTVPAGWTIVNMN